MAGRRLSDSSDEWPLPVIKPPSFRMKPGSRKGPLFLNATWDQTSIPEMKGLERASSSLSHRDLAVIPVNTIKEYSTERTNFMGATMDNINFGNMHLDSPGSSMDAPGGPGTPARQAFVVDSSHLAPTVTEDLLSKDPAVATKAARSLAEFCDLFLAGKEAIEEHRTKAGKLPDIWDNLATLILEGKRQPKSDGVLWAATAVGFIAFGNQENTLAVAQNAKMLRAISEIVTTGSEEEKAAGAGATSNICSSGHGNKSKVLFAQCPDIVGALIGLCESGGEGRLRAVGSFANMSCSDESREILVANDKIAEALEKIVPLSGEGDAHDVLKARAVMALANLKGRTEGGVSFVADNEVMRTIVVCLECALGFLCGEKRMYGNVIWTVSMVLYPIYQLSIADRNKPSLLEAGVVTPLLRLLAMWQAGQSTANLEWILLTLQQLAFDEECKSIIADMIYHPADDPEIETLSVNGLDALGRIAEVDPKSELLRTRDTGGSLGLLARNFQEQIDMAMDLENYVDQDAENKWIMISYNWDVQEQAKEMCHQLQDQGYTVWMDILEGCMGGDTLQAMADAVGKAALVLVFVTIKYKESANCRREASYANDLKKPIVPIIMEESYHPDASWGWLGLIIAGKMYYNLSQNNPNRNHMMQELLKCPEILTVPKNVLMRSQTLATINKSKHIREAQFVRSKTERVMDNLHDGKHYAHASLPHTPVTSRETSPMARLDSRHSSHEENESLGLPRILMRRQSTLGHGLASNKPSAPLSSLERLGASDRRESLSLLGQALHWQRLRAAARCNSAESDHKSNEADVVTRTASRRGSLDPLEQHSSHAHANRDSSCGSGKAHRHASSLASGGGAQSPPAARGFSPSPSEEDELEALARDPGYLEIHKWLTSLHADMAQYAVVFLEQQISSLDMVAELTEKDMESEIEPMVKSVGHRILLRRGVQHMKMTHHKRLSSGSHHLSVLTPDAHTVRCAQSVPELYGHSSPGKLFLPRRVSNEQYPANGTFDTSPTGTFMNQVASTFYSMPGPTKPVVKDGLQLTRDSRRSCCIM